jgi:hypothetical protein
MVNSILAYPGPKPQRVGLDTVVTITEGDYLIIGHNYKVNFRLVLQANSETHAKKLATELLSCFAEIEAILYMGML